MQVLFSKSLDFDFGKVVALISKSCFLPAFLLPLLMISPAVRAQDPPLTPETLRTALAARPSGDDANRLADRIRAWFGKDNLLKGPNPKIDGLSASWAIEAPGAMMPPVVASEGNGFRLRLRRVGDTDVYAGTASLQDGAGFRWAYEVDNRNLGGGQLEIYSVQADSREQPGVPKGVVTKRAPWKSHVFEGTERDWWVYVPAQYKSEEPAAVMMFQDGASYQGYVHTVFDNLIAKGEMPATVGIFIEPGHFSDGRSNRSFEYDTLSDQYARFLLEEILPEVEKTIKLRHDPESRAIAGASSGGICAFTVAWERPDQFSKVLSWVGSFTDIASGPTKIAGGHNYPALIRKTDPKPIRVFLQDGANDLDNVHGNWPLANQGMAKALAFQGYDYKFVFGNGFHSHNHGRAILPDSLRWLWRKE
jgi:enterochelin esterase family protein